MYDLGPDVIPNPNTSREGKGGKGRTREGRGGKRKEQGIGQTGGRKGEGGEGKVGVTRRLESVRVLYFPLFKKKALGVPEKSECFKCSKKPS